MDNFISYFILINIFYFINFAYATNFNYPYVTCGSSIKLYNNHNQIRLHSHEVKYGQGSGQQSVTGVKNADDKNSYWQVRAKSGVECVRGNPIKCGQTIRLTHVTTGRNLHSHHFASPLSHNLEVSAFGEKGEGDDGDEWSVTCSDTYWQRDRQVRLKHVVTDGYLHVSGNKFGRPIAGQFEVCGIPTLSNSNLWLAAEGIYVKPNEEKPIQSNDDDEDAGEEEEEDDKATSQLHDSGEF